ncbi:MAG: hypothetical protein HC892_08770 [Saprospiraceae bacterium]|nr:hypothetical protein [Saprospiraceae bacterium]
MAGSLLVVRYSNGDDIIALKPDGINGNIRTFKELIPGFTGFVDPLDLTEDTRNGNLYVSEYYEHQDGGKITLLTPKSVSSTNKAPIVTFESPTSGQNYNVGTNLYVKVNATDSDGSVQKVDLYLMMLLYVPKRRYLTSGVIKPTLHSPTCSAALTLCAQ